MVDLMTEVLDMEEELEDLIMEMDGLLMEDLEGWVTEGLRGLLIEDLAGLVREDLAEDLSMPAVIFTAITTRRGWGKRGHIWNRVKNAENKKMVSSES